MSLDVLAINDNSNAIFHLLKASVNLVDNFVTFLATNNKNRFIGSLNKFIAFLSISTEMEVYKAIILFKKSSIFFHVFESFLGAIAPNETDLRKWVSAHKFV